MSVASPKLLATGIDLELCFLLVSAEKVRLFTPHVVGDISRFLKTCFLCSISDPPLLGRARQGRVSLVTHPVLVDSSFLPFSLVDFPA